MSWKGTVPSPEHNSVFSPAPALLGYSLEKRAGRERALNAICESPGDARRGELPGNWITNRLTTFCSSVLLYFISVILGPPFSRARRLRDKANRFENRIRARVYWTLYIDCWSYYRRKTVGAFPSIYNLLIFYVRMYLRSRTLQNLNLEANHVTTIVNLLMTLKILNN